MEKTYQPKQLEARWYKFWEERGYFAPDEAKDADPYCIVIPPPNVTGRLHMGHGFQHAIMDALIRYQRMQGRPSLWQVGTDHAGIATQMVVERQLEAEGSSRHELGREAFVERVWQWKAESGGVITDQLRRMGSSPDWSRERFTMDEGFCRAVNRVFIQLYDEGLIYRGERLVNWDPQLHTAISDLEVVSEEEDGHLWHFRYPLADGRRAANGSDAVTVATTRPETMLGDTAVAVHPEDSRYKSLVGGAVELPLVGRRIPIIADDYVDPEFGSGCVKITPAHDFNDYAMGRRHNLDVINILTPDAAINDAAPETYRSMDRFEARKRVVADMEKAGLLAKVEKHRLKVPRGDRSGAVIEPYLTPQWYVAVEKLAAPAIAAVEDGRIQFVPKNWENTYFAWMRDIQDWCISRQLWWGHRIPAWYDEGGKVYVGESEAAVREKYGLDGALELRQDGDVLDTWFSSALWSFVTLGWPDDEASDKAGDKANNKASDKTSDKASDKTSMQHFHPTDVLVTGFDIIFFWVARMIMMTLKFTGQVPFRQVYITGLVRDEHGQKMSKSKGNILDPIDLMDGISLEALTAKRTADMMQPRIRKEIEDRTRQSFPNGIPGYGTDALRFTYYSLASTGRDIKFDLKRTEGFRNFCNKIWNATRYVLMHNDIDDGGSRNHSPLEGESERQGRSPQPSRWGDPNPEHLSVADKWILSRLNQAAAEVAESMATYRFDLASQTLHRFLWDEFCDWYVELSKPVLWDDSEDPTTAARAQAARYTLLSVLEASMRLLHPFMPFITEEIWQKLAPLLGLEGDSIMVQPYPRPVEAAVDPEAEAHIKWIQGIVTAVRNIRGEMDISPAKSIPVLLSGDTRTKAHQQRLETFRPYLTKLAKLESIQWLDESATPPSAATQIHDGLEILVPLAGLIDTAAERARLHKEIDKLQKSLTAVTQKLANEKFTSKAPESVVAAERDKQARLSASLTALKQKSTTLDAL